METLIYLPKCVANLQAIVGQPLHQRNENLCSHRRFYMYVKEALEQPKSGNNPNVLESVYG